LDVDIMVKNDMNAALPEKPWLSNRVEAGCTKTRPLSCVKYLIVLASGSSSTAPDMDEANFFSGNWIRAICGLNADAVSARRSMADVDGDDVVVVAGALLADAR
jgi:hypothetical protein